jgi:hypothetical protein
VKIESNITPGTPSKLISMVDNKEIKIDGSDKTTSGLLVAIADPKTRIMLDKKSFDINLEECDPNINCVDYIGF